LAKTASDKPTAPAEESKRRKKQARREAKLMLAIEAAKKAQKKQSRAQARLEERSTYVQTLEARLAELRAQSPQAATDATLQSATAAEPTSLLGEEATLPEGTVAIKDATEGEAMRENETAVERAPAPTTSRKTSAQKTAAARTSTATKRPASHGQRTRKPSLDAEQEE
jgi:hypothetical protein